MSLLFVKRGHSCRRRLASARCVWRLGPLSIGLLLQTTATGCDPSATLATLQQDLIAGIGTGISNLAQALILELFI
jgi:hypothetical protein